MHMGESHEEAVCQVYDIFRLLFVVCGAKISFFDTKYCYSLQMTKIYVQIIISCARLDSVTLVNFLKELYE